MRVKILRNLKSVKFFFFFWANIYHQVLYTRKKILFPEDFYIGNFHNFFLSSREMNAISSL